MQGKGLILISLIALILISQVSAAPLLAVFNTSAGAVSWTAPANLTQITTDMSGGGHGGGGCTAYSTCWGKGGSNGSLVWDSIVSVSPGTSYSGWVGEGGTAGAAGGGAGGNGNSTTMFGLTAAGSTSYVAGASQTYGATGVWNLWIKLSGDGNPAGTLGGNGSGAGGGQGKDYYTVNTAGGVGAPGVIAIYARNYTNYTYPAAAFSALPNAGPSPLTVQFVDTSTGGTITSWLWEFGDGVTNTTQNPTHTFPGNTTYTVNLTVTNDLGSNKTTGTVSTDTWITSTYTVGVAAIAYQINSSIWVPSSYTYHTQVQNAGTGFVTDYRTIATAYGSYDIITEGNPNYTVGSTYDVKLLAIDTLGNTYILDTDSFTVGILWFSGTVVSQDGTPISGATVSVTQAGNVTSTTTNATGQYTISGQIEDLPVTFSFYKSGYQTTTFTFTPFSSRQYVVGATLIPPPTFDSVYIKWYGIVQSHPYYQPVPGATVILQGNSLYRTNTSNAYGYYEFPNITISDGQTYSLITSYTIDYQVLNETCYITGGSASCV